MLMDKIDVELLMVNLDVESTLLMDVLGVD